MRKGILLAFIFWGFLAGRNSASGQDLKTTEAHYRLGKFEIVIIQHKRNWTARDNMVARPLHCSASVEIRKKGRIIEKFDFGDIMPPGGPPGIFLPKKQESPKHFILVKHGGYDSRALVITDKGRRFDIAGYAYRFFLGRYLITEGSVAESSPAFTVFDLRKNELLLTLDPGDSIPWATGPPLPPSQAYLIKLYTKGPELFAIVDIVEFSTFKTLGHVGRVYRIDLKTKKIRETNTDEKGLEEFVIDDSNMDMTTDCECKETTVKIVPPDPKHPQ
ncbi:MAG: hypothetical protein ABFD80_10900 [Acidobacteriota bacterium]